MRMVRLCLALLCASGIAAAQENPPGRAPPPAARPAEPERLPADATTHHTLDLPGRALSFAATAGAIRLRGDTAEPQADVAFIAYQLDGVVRTTRPVTFVFNGGPGEASGWLHTGVLGPWRIPFAGATPSSPPDPAPNADTWLDFTDLVFLDPPGTGYSRVLGNEETRRRLWSVTGDIDALAEVIRRWLDKNGRNVSPAWLVGESYGGFRGPRLARALQSDRGVGVSGMVLISPLLDVHVESGYTDPFAWADRLPSLAAAARSRNGPVSRADLADTETYAMTEYLTDLVRGQRDAEAVARMARRVAALTGLDPALTARYRGRIDIDVFLHEFDRTRGRVGSVYDPTTGIGDPNPHRVLSDYPDPMYDGLTAPITGATMAIYTGKLNWRPDRVWRLHNHAAARQWDWGRSIGRPQSLSALQQALALDPAMRVLIVHGLFDLRTPYFTTARMLNNLDDEGSARRVKLAVYPGGHMFYSDDASRAAFRDAARVLYQRP